MFRDGKLCNCQFFLRSPALVIKQKPMGCRDCNQYEPETIPGKLQNNTEDNICRIGKSIKKHNMPFSSAILAALANKISHSWSRHLDTCMWADAFSTPIVFSKGYIHMSIFLKSSCSKMARRKDETRRKDQDPMKCRKME